MEEGNDVATFVVSAYLGGALRRCGAACRSNGDSPSTGTCQFIFLSRPLV
jgi:hypothetical protein